MIVDDQGGEPDGAPVPWHPPGALDVLDACVREADRQAEMLSRIDKALGCALASGDLRPGLPLLQSIDLLRQESQALARVLRIVAEDPSPDRRLDVAQLSGCIPVARQRARMLAP
ncbi:hypothetical protein N8I71_02010 [Roseibacterium sp. SDUM158016]|uniref:hypothetical protein n=1 Tax=Roseicyclus sediminis TaxID=2980997 RepID=UPI0021D10BBC|nr:hypothetical protein [Roseibacterium sp. SDUM158016]MCU4651587.1 hypothetical protein [Roseibacterium sp. SDUM158016]